MSAYIPVGSLMFTMAGKEPIGFLAVDGTVLDNPSPDPTLGLNTSGFVVGGIFQLGDGTIAATAVPGSGTPGSGSPAYPFGARSEFYTSGLVQTATYAESTNSTTRADNCISSNYVDRVYLSKTGYNVGQLTTIRELNLSGSQTRSWVLPAQGAFSGGGQQFWTSPDGTRAYYYAIDTAQRIFAHDLSADSDLGLFYDISLGPSSASGTNPIIVLRDSSIIASMSDASAGFLYHLSSGGSLVSTYSVGAYAPFVVTPGLDDSSFWVSCYQISNSSRFRVFEIRVSDGTVLHQFDKTISGTPGVDTWGSTFCVVRYAFGAPPDDPGGDVPASPPSIPRIQCTPAAIVASPSRNSGCNQGGVGWTPSYTSPISGSMPIGANPVDGEPLTGQRSIHIWAEIQHTHYF